MRSSLMSVPEWSDQSNHPMQWSRVGWYALQAALAAFAIYVLAQRPDPNIPSQNVSVAVILFVWAVSFGVSRIVDWWRYGTWFAAVRWSVPRLVVFWLIFQLVQNTTSGLGNAFIASLMWSLLLISFFYGSQWLVDASQRWNWRTGLAPREGGGEFIERPPVGQPGGKRRVIGS